MKTGLSTDELGALAAQLNPSRSISLPGGGSIDIHGISVPNAVTLYRRHAGELSTWFERLALQAAESEQSAFNFDGAIASALLDAVPEIAADVIAMAMGFDDPAATAIVRRMGLSPQISALQVIADLTFTEDMPPKKLFEIVIQTAGLVPGEPSPPSDKV